MLVAVIGPNHEAMPVPDHLETHQIVAGCERNEKERGGAPEKARLKTAGELQEREVHDPARHLGQSKAELPPSRRKPVHKDRKDDDAEDVAAQVGPERKVEKVE